MMPMSCSFFLPPACFVQAHPTLHPTLHFKKTGLLPASLTIMFPEVLVKSLTPSFDFFGGSFHLGTRGLAGAGTGLAPGAPVCGAGTGAGAMRGPRLAEDQERSDSV